jgi:hypothetical protein
VVRYRCGMTCEKRAFSPGTKVGVRFSGRVVQAFIVEDRGVFGGQRIVRVRLGDWNDRDALEFELPADELEPLPAAA